MSKERVIKKISVNGIDYKVVDESYEDDYGSYRSNYVAYKKEKGKWERLSPEWYALYRWDAESFLPHKIIKCKCCGQVTYEAYE